MLHECRLRGVPCIVENPYLSRLWDQPSFQKLRVRSLREALSDYCQDGTRWRKRMRFWGFNVDFEGFYRKCTGRGLCSRTGLPHVTLLGLDKGSFLTATAEPYPRPLCRRACDMLANGVVAKRVVDLEVYLTPALSRPGTSLAR